MAINFGGLGKGLDAIFQENESEDKSDVVTLKISDIEPNRKQPRKEFGEVSLNELSQSIMQYGVLQPILVRPLMGGGYQIVAGERRYRASRLAGLTEIPVVIRELTDNETMELAMIENLQREDLTDLEEAQGYQTLIDVCNYSQEQLSKIVGKSRSAIANSLRLLSLPEEIKTLLNEEKLSAGHARALLSIVATDKMIEAAKLVVEKGLSVRETEKLAKAAGKTKEKGTTNKSSSKPVFYKEVEMALSEYLGKKVSVSKGKEKNSGVLSIEFYSDAELQELANKLK